MTEQINENVDEKVIKGTIIRKILQTSSRISNLWDLYLEARGNKNSGNTGSMVNILNMATILEHEMKILKEQVNKGKELGLIK